LINALAAQGVITVGIDTPSIDPADSQALESHQAVFDRDMAVLEGLVLSGVPDGLYRLVALPLRLKAAAASPVRAILLK
jgi:arylformamidase